MLARLVRGNSSLREEDQWRGLEGRCLVEEVRDKEAESEARDKEAESRDKEQVVRIPLRGGLIMWRMVSRQGK